jgi:hypothetical protein
MRGDMKMIFEYVTKPSSNRLFERNMESRYVRRYGLSTAHL